VYITPQKGFIKFGSFDIIIDGKKFFLKSRELAPGCGFSQGFQDEIGIFFSGKKMMFITTGTVIGFPGVILFTVPTHNNQRIKVEGRTLLSINLIVPIGIKGIFDAVLMFAIGGEGIYIGSIFY